MDLKYEQPNMPYIISEYEKLLDDFEGAQTAKTQLKIIENINAIRDDFFSMYWLSYINYLLDVNNEYWNEQESFFAQNDPIMNNFRLRYYDALNNSLFKDELAKIIGDKVFKIAAFETRLMSDEITEELKREKELANDYNRLFATAKLVFNGEELSLSQLGKYVTSSDRNVRINASKVRYDFMESIENKIDSILDELIKVRTSMAKKLGFTSYTDFSYIKMKRLDYNKKDVEVFRNEILSYVVPLVLQIKEKQRQELGLDVLMYYDSAVLFKDGNAVPKGDTSWIVEEALKMFEEISPKLYNLFKKMVEESLMDLDSRQGKKGGGIATYIPNYKVPIFISNFNGTSNDLHVLTHEFGHCFQLYSSRNLKYYENWWPTFDACEIHSTSMELLTLPFMDKFFKEDKNKYIYEKMVSVLEKLCYICLIDEFQHRIYDDSDLDINNRKTIWLELEKKYMPWLNFDDNKYLQRGNVWQQQTHIFAYPFYFIDYALADCVALQFYYLSLSDFKTTWDKYIRFCELGGMHSFVDSIAKIGLKSPFEKNTLKNILEKLYKEKTII